VEDLRDLGGRLRRLMISIVVGIIGSIALGLCFPISEVQPLLHGCTGRSGSQLVMEDVPLLLAGTVAIACACYAVLAWHARRLRIPSARVVR
jgi:ABC-type antimicrobial peptide transport system permease subunit